MYSIQFNAVALNKLNNPKPRAVYSFYSTVKVIISNVAQIQAQAHIRTIITLKMVLKLREITSNYKITTLKGKCVFETNAFRFDTCARMFKARATYTILFEWICLLFPFSSCKTKQNPTILCVHILFVFQINTCAKKLQIFKRLKRNPTMSDCLSRHTSLNSFASFCVSSFVSNFFFFSSKT